MSFRFLRSDVVGGYSKIILMFGNERFVWPQIESETFSSAARFGLRWFTPTREVPLCGHATLATAAVIYKELGELVAVAVVIFVFKKGTIFFYNFNYD